MGVGRGGRRKKGTWEEGSVGNAGYEGGGWEFGGGWRGLRGSGGEAGVGGTSNPVCEDLMAGGRAAALTQEAARC